MPLYQMLCIAAHAKEYASIKDLVVQSACHVMAAGGVVRDIRSWGTRALPQRMKRHGNHRTIGDYWTLHFDTSPRTVHSLNGLMRRDPRVIRWTILKLGEKPEDIARIHEKTARRN